MTKIFKIASLSLLGLILSSREAFADLVTPGQLRRCVTRPTPEGIKTYCSGPDVGSLIIIGAVIVLIIIISVVIIIRVRRKKDNVANLK